MHLFAQWQHFNVSLFLFLMNLKTHTVGGAVKAAGMQAQSVEAELLGELSSCGSPPHPSSQKPVRKFFGVSDFCIDK